MTQIFKLSFRSLKNQDGVKILLCDCNPNFSGESLAFVDITNTEGHFLIKEIAGIARCDQLNNKEF
jgi:hypothetical protein